VEAGSDVVLIINEDNSFRVAGISIRITNMIKSTSKNMESGFFFLR